MAIDSALPHPSMALDLDSLRAHGRPAYARERVKQCQRQVLSLSLSLRVWLSSLMCTHSSCHLDTHLMRIVCFNSMRSKRMQQTRSHLAPRFPSTVTTRCSIAVCVCVCPTHCHRRRPAVVAALERPAAAFTSSDPMSQSASFVEPCASHEHSDTNQSVLRLTHPLDSTAALHYSTT